MSPPATLHYRALQDADCAVLERMLPPLLPGNWSQAHLQQLQGTAHQCRVLCASAAAGQPPLGFAEFMLIVDEGELLALAIAPELQGQGLGRALLVSLLDELRAEGCRVCHLEVRRSNEAAIALYAGQGFQLSGMRKGYYPLLPGQTAAEDALLYSLAL